jgi:hypothetical protein
MNITHPSAPAGGAMSTLYFVPLGVEVMLSTLPSSYNLSTSVSTLIFKSSVFLVLPTLLNLFSCFSAFGFTLIVSVCDTVTFYSFLDY